MDRRAWLLIGLLASLWGASYLFIKVALEDLSPLAIVFARTFLGAVVILPFARSALPAMRDHARMIAFVAIIQIAVPFLLIAAGEQYISSSLAGILVASAPIFTAVLAVLFVHSERLPGAGLVGVAVGMSGVVLLFGVDLSGDALLGGGMVLLAGLGYAAGALLAKKRLSAVPPVGLAAGVMSISALATLPALPFALPDHAPGLDTIGALLALGCGGTGAAFLLFYTLNAEIGPSRASIVAYVSPGFSVAYGVALLGESLTVATLAGLALILAGSWLAGGRSPKRALNMGARTDTTPCVSPSVQRRTGRACRIPDDITSQSTRAAATATASSRPTASSTSSPRPS